MAATQNGNVGIYSGYTDGDNGWTSQHNGNWDLLDVLLQCAVINMTTTAPPGSPANGDAYIVATGGTGAWSGKDGKIAAWVRGAWQFVTPKSGWQIANKADSNNYRYNGSAWVGSQPFDLTAFFPGIPTSSAIVLRVPVARPISFPANFSGSYAKARVAAAASTVFDVQKNGTSIGSITFATSASTATFTTSSGAAQSLAAGDVIAIIAPSSADANLADIGFVLTGTR